MACPPSFCPKGNIPRTPKHVHMTHLELLETRSAVTSGAVAASAAHAAVGTRRGGQRQVGVEVQVGVGGLLQGRQEDKCETHGKQPTIACATHYCPFDCQRYSPSDINGLHL